MSTFPNTTSSTDYTGTAIQSASSLLQSGVNAAINAGEHKKQRSFAREMYEKQVKQANAAYDKARKDNLADYERQRADYISDLLNADIRATQSRRNAGLSVAFGEGYSAAQPLGERPSGITQDVMSSPSASAVGSSPISQLFDPSSMLVDAQRKNIEADTLKKNAETKGQLTTNEQLKLDLEKAKQTFDADVAQATATLNDTLSRIDINKEQKEKLSREIEKVVAETKSITFDVEKLKPQELKNLKKTWEQMVAQINNINAQTSLTEVEKSIKEIQEHFNSMGIGVGSGLFDSVLGLLTSGNGKDVVTSLKGFVGDLFKGIVSIDIPSVVGSVAEGTKNIVNGVNKALYDGVSSLFGKEVADMIDNSPYKFVEWLKDNIRPRYKGTFINPYK